MEGLRALFDYQKFAANPRLQAKIDAVYEKYLAQGAALADEELDVSAAGEGVPAAKRRVVHGDK